MAIARMRSLTESVKLRGGKVLLNALGAQLRGEDLNLRPSGYEPDELPLLFRAIVRLNEWSGSVALRRGLLFDLAHRSAGRHRNSDGGRGRGDG